MAKDSNSKPYKYDVFISYSHRNRERVVSQLIKPLQKAGLEVHWDQKFRIGQNLIDEIVDGIQLSRKVIVVFSRSYRNAKTGWPAFEIALAQTESIMKKENKVLPIRFQDVPLPRKLSPLIYKDAFRTVPESLLDEIINEVRPTQEPAFQFTNGGSCLAVGSHWDDILLGCLGTLLKLKRIFHFNIDVLVLCNSYEDFYYGAKQKGLTSKAEEIYKDLCKVCRFKNLREIRDNNIVDDRLGDRSLRESIASLRNIMEAVIKYSIDKNGTSYNLVLGPPIDDSQDDHAATGEVVFSNFRDPEHMVIEYEIKRYTDKVFIPNLCVGLDDIISKRNRKPHSVADEKIRLILKVCQVRKNVINSSRLFDEKSLKSRMVVNAIDHGKNKAIKHAEIFRGRFEL